MGCLFFIIQKSIKNSLKELIKKPGRLAMYIFIIIILIALVISSFFSKTQAESASPMYLFTGILFLFISVFLFIAVNKGLSRGDVIFDMSDVNLLFVSPVSPRKILLYGIARTAKEAFWAGFFILFQVNLLGAFGAGYSAVLLTFACFMLSVVVLTILSLFIYSFCSEVSNGAGGKKIAGFFTRKHLVISLAAAQYLPLAVYFAKNFYISRDFFLALEKAVLSPFLQFIPAAGWTACSVSAFLSGELPKGFFFLALNLLLGAGISIFIVISKSDYYEDVLTAAETSYEKKRAAIEGRSSAGQRLNGDVVSHRTIRASNTGIFGVGAAAVFGRHIKESFRQNRLGFLNLTSLFLIIGAAAVSFFDVDLAAIMQILMWIQIFLIKTGRGLPETCSHFIFMIPETSFKKIIWSNLEIIVKTFIESIFIFIICGILLKAAPFLIIACIFTYTFFSLLLLGINYLSMRLTGADISSGVLLTIYVIAVVLIMLPGAAASVTTGVIIGGDKGILAGLLILAFWEAAAGFICFALSKGVLHNCDMGVLKPPMQS